MAFNSASLSEAAALMLRLASSILSESFSKMSADTDTLRTGSPVRQVWITVERVGCGKRSRFAAPVPDVFGNVTRIGRLRRGGLAYPDLQA